MAAISYPRSRKFGLIRAGEARIRAAMRRNAGTPAYADLKASLREARIRADDWHIAGQQPDAADGDGGRSYQAAVDYQAGRAHEALRRAGLFQDDYAESADGKTDEADHRRMDREGGS